MLLCGTPLGKYPVSIPQIAPNGEKDARYKETNVWANAVVFEAANHQVVNDKANAFNKNVAAGVLHLTQMYLALKSPQTLHRP
jgi:hypothetical protein